MKWTAFTLFAMAHIAILGLGNWGTAIARMWLEGLRAKIIRLNYLIDDAGFKGFLCTVLACRCYPF